MKWKYFDAIAAGFSIQDDCRPLRRLERWRGSQWTSFSSSTAALKPPATHTTQRGGCKPPCVLTYCMDSFKLSFVQRSTATLRCDDIQGDNQRRVCAHISTSL